MPRYISKGKVKDGNVNIDRVAAPNVLFAWYALYDRLVIRGLKGFLDLWRRSGYVIEDEDGNFHQPVIPDDGPRYR